MRTENKLMVEFLKANGITAKARYIHTGSLRGCWSLYNCAVKWSLELQQKLMALGFYDYDGRPISEHAGNGGMFSVFVRGHLEILERAQAATAEVLGFTKTDCGRSDAGFKERADCTVRATAAALGIPYTDAHAKLASLGRKNRRGFKFDQPAALKALGLSRREWKGGLPLQYVLPEIQQGRHIVRVRRHVFAVVDGKTIDNSLPLLNKRVTQVYTVQPNEVAT